MIERDRGAFDGRAIVYDIYKFSTNFQGEHSVTARRGVLLSPRIAAITSDIVEAIRKVANQLAEVDGHGDSPWDSPHGDAGRWQDVAPTHSHPFATGLLAGNCF